ncbi:hypothetical protein [Parasphingorhabdus cellanae]|uniref:Uncharacterized protein n=1 Tax=Parasphingorhabdus cellanae TaxID=2806553 RepID=A0ABX7T8V5_9SPHN|nr:hypothetical protein [Parasphingorhabdus cellanae]QTD57581.1 hypothetical protein J4G78_08710 [Parasphingorhabdus cellanae]
MFGKRTSVFGKKAVDTPPSPPPGPPVDSWEPEDKMIIALEAAIRLFSRTLEQAGLDCGRLALSGEPPAKVSLLLADCIVYSGKEGKEFLALGRSKDFRSFSFEPHFRMFLILNAVLILEDLPPSVERSQIAISEVPRQLMDAHLMLCWVRFIRPLGKAWTGPEAEMGEMIHDMQNELVAVGQSAPGWLTERVSTKDCVQEWGSAFPATLGQTLEKDTPRINGLPMTDIIEEATTKFLVDTQVQGLKQSQGRI